MTALIDPAKATGDDGNLDDEDIEETLRDVRRFLHDPVALLERAAYLLRTKKNEIATWLLFGAVATFLFNQLGPIADLATV